MGKPQADGVRVVCTNRKARHEYEILDVIEAGLALQGTEVKSLRDGRASLVGAYALLDGSEAWLKSAEIQEYSHGNRQNHDPKRTRKLLLKRIELRKIEARTRERGVTLVPLSLYFRGPYAKVEIAIARGRKHADRRQAVAKREAAREIARATGRRR